MWVSAKVESGRNYLLYSISPPLPLPPTQLTCYHQLGIAFHLLLRETHLTHKETAEELWKHKKNSNHKES